MLQNCSFYHMQCLSKVVIIISSRRYTCPYATFCVACMEYYSDNILCYAVFATLTYLWCQQICVHFKFYILKSVACYKVAVYIICSVHHNHNHQFQEVYLPIFCVAEIAICLQLWQYLWYKHHLCSLMCCWCAVSTCFLVILQSKWPVQLAHTNISSPRGW